MATLALSLAGQALGGAFGGPLGAMAGRALGALAGNAIDQAIFGQDVAPAPTGDIRLPNASEGGALPRIYGWTRLSGNIIWATELERQTAQNSGAKGLGGGEGKTELLANFAVAFCQGEVAHMGRIWADGRLLEPDGLNIRFYAGTENQSADGLIVAKQGPQNAPAYRGVCYVVFEALPLAQFGNRIPVINVELCRPVGELEPAIRAVSVIPGSTEFGYDPSPRVRLLSPGVTEPENTHILSHASDWSLSIDELQAMCPNLEHVALVTSWFGSDLRCGQCAITPRVERAGKTVEGADWVVGGLGRSQANPVSTVNNGPAYGGTPADASLIAAIADLKARGIKVTFYPFLMMDIAPSNTLPDPYTGVVGQPSYPWRGRITCDPAPAMAGSPDQTTAAATQLESFLGTASPAHFTRQTDTVTYSGPLEWSYRRFILHYAHLCALAGGVDAFLIGSELRGLSQLRSGASAFPFVTALQTLAADVRATIGPSCKLTYAADWTEYAGYQPADAPGDKLFHLDALWADPNIDAVAIDNYMPLSDWRDDETQADTDAGTPRRLSYLQANIAGGEGYDWYYASPADRQAHIRTPITDGANGESWIWRYKDLVNWWQMSHFDRIGGARAPNPSPWVPQSKPIWFTELGCAAVDKGGNGPNAFPDPKSSENSLPPFSTGAPDGLMQRQFLRAHFRHWLTTSPDFNAASNPISSVYGARMLDAARIYLWAWDARPYPAFPALGGIWADGENYERGHWLNGRLGAAAPDELLTTIAADYAVTLSVADPGETLVGGCHHSSEDSLRAAIEQRLAATALNLAERQGALVAISPHQGGRAVVDKASLVDEGEALMLRSWKDGREEIGRLCLGYTDRRRDFAAGEVTVVNGREGREVRQDPRLVLGYPEARQTAEQLFFRAQEAVQTLEITLPPSLAGLEPGDRMQIPQLGAMDWLIDDIRRAGSLRVSAHRLGARQKNLIFGEDRAVSLKSPAGRSLPEVELVHLPARNASEAAVVQAGSYAKPWPGHVSIRHSANAVPPIELTEPASMGKLAAELLPGPAVLWDRANMLEVELYDGHLASASPGDVLAGRNRLAVLHDDGQWEIVGFVNASLVGKNRYQLTQLLRSLRGTAPNPTLASAGAAAVVLDTALKPVPVGSENVGSTLAMTAFAGATDVIGVPVTLDIGRDPVKPLSPVHLGARRDPATGDVTLTWVRRSRLGQDNWAIAEVPLDSAPEQYRVSIISGGAVARSLQSSTPQLVYTFAEQTADFGALPTSVDFSVTQTSAVYGPGHPANAVIAL